MKNKSLLIYGTGTISELAYFYFKKDSDYDVRGFVDDEEFVKKGAPAKFGCDVFSWYDAVKMFPVNQVDFFVAVGYAKRNSVRQKRYEMIRDEGYTCASYVSSRATVLSSEIGQNSFILENNVIQPFVSIGHNVTLWSGNHIGHHSIIHDNVFVASQAVISGKCVIGNNAFIGVNSTIHDGVSIGKNSIIGAGSIVKTSCEPYSVFVPQATKPRVFDRDLI